MKILSRIMVVWVIVIFVIGSAAAQESTEIFTFDSGVAFSYPADWTPGDADGATINVTSDLTSVTVLDYPFFDAMGLAPDADLALALETYFAEAHDGDFDDKALSEVEVGARAGARFDYEDDSGNSGLLLALPFTDGGFGMIDAASLDGAMQEEDAVLAIAESFDSAAVSGGGCTISTDQERTVRVHVGPGENRGVLAFLPANREFEVAGQNTADDDSVWWRLADASTVKPNAATSEAWVAEADVTESGGCDALGTAAEPPIRVQIAAPPPTTNEGSSGDTSAPPATGGLPQAGTWTIYYSSRSPGSCIGDNVSSETIWLDLPIPSETHPLTVSGGTVVYGGRQLIPTGENRFRSQWDLPVEGEIMASDARLILDSATQMHGEMQFTMSFGGGISCSITVSVTITRG